MVEGAILLSGHESLVLKHRALLNPLTGEDVETQEIGPAEAEVELQVGFTDSGHAVLQCHAKLVWAQKLLKHAVLQDAQGVLHVKWSRHGEEGVGYAVSPTRNPSIGAMP